MIRGEEGMFKFIRKKEENEIATAKDAAEDSQQELVHIAEGIFLDRTIDKANVSGISMPIAQLATLGAGVSSIIPSLQAASNMSSIGSEGLYRLANESVGDTLKMAKNGNFWGAFHTADGRSKFVQLQKVDLPATNSFAAINPATMMMAVALFSIEQQLGRIEKLEQEILSFLEREKESEIEADIETLYDILSKYKFNWDNTHFISSNHKMVLDIQRTARKNMLSYQKQLSQTLESKQLLISQTQVNMVFKELMTKIQYYRLSVFSFSMASLIEIMLSGNFKEENIENVKDEIIKSSMIYRELFSKCSVFLKKKSKSSIETNLLKGLGNAGKTAGNLIGNIPVVKKGPVDEALQDGGEKLKRNAKNLEVQVTERLSQYNNPGTGVFIEKMDDLITIYNHTERIAFDDENIYLIAG